MIRLDPSLQIAAGRTRECYFHPESPDLVIKVPRQDTPPGVDPNAGEWRHWQEIRAKHGDVPGIAPCFGKIATDRGEGLVMACIRDADGRCSRPLSHCFSHPESWDLVAVRAALSMLLTRICDAGIRLFDLNAANILLQVAEDQSIHPTVIDLKGPYDNKEFIPVSTYIPWFAKRKIMRRTRRMLDRFDRKTARPGISA